jgi:hypothetical protein
MPVDEVKALIYHVTEGLSGLLPLGSAKELEAMLQKDSVSISDLEKAVEYFASAANASVSAAPEATASLQQAVVALEAEVATLRRCEWAL